MTPPVEPLTAPASASQPAWTDPLLANPHAVADKADRVNKMFSAIAPSYDLNNRLHSMGMDQHWRNVAVKMAGVKRDSNRIVDVACGTGDLTLKFAEKAIGGSFPALLARYLVLILPMKCCPLRGESGFDMELSSTKNSMTTTLEQRTSSSSCKAMPLHCHCRTNPLTFFQSPSGFAMCRTGEMQLRSLRGC